MNDYSNMEFVGGWSGGPRFEWVAPAKDLRRAGSIAIPDSPALNPVGDTPEENELWNLERAAAKEIADGLAARLKTEGIFVRVEQSQSASVDLVFRVAITDFRPGAGLGPHLLGRGHGFLRVEGMLVEAGTGQIVGRVQATALQGGGLAHGLIGLAVALSERRPQEEIIIQLRDFLRTKVKKLESRE